MNAVSPSLMLIAIGVLGVALGGWIGWAWLPSRRRIAPLPTEWALAARPVFSASERHAYDQLRRAYPQHVVLPKLPLVRFCQPATPEQVGYWYQLIGAAHVSFAICTPNGEVVLVIDLDSGRSHSRRSTHIKQSVLSACGIKRFHCMVDALPPPEALRSLIPGHSVQLASPVGSSDFVATQPPTSPAQNPAATVARPQAVPPEPSHDQSVFLDSFFTPDERAPGPLTAEPTADDPAWTTRAVRRTSPRPASTVSS